MTHGKGRHCSDRLHLAGNGACQQVITLLASAVACRVGWPVIDEGERANEQALAKAGGFRLL